MNHASGSALQKVSFVLVLFIAAAAGYLVVRERLRANQQREAELAAAAAAANPSPAPTVPARAASPVEKPSFAPLRARVETNVVRVPSNRFIGVPGPGSNRLVVVGQKTVQDAVRVEPGLAVDAPMVVGVGGGARGRGQSITGRVLLQGTPPPEKVIVMDATCSALQPAPITTRHYVVGEGGALADVFVYVKSGALTQRAGAGVAPPLLDQINCEYQPYVLGVQTGQGLNVRNSDPLLHNVHVLPVIPGNRERNIGQPVKGMTTRMTFDKPEVLVQFKCDVHPWMFAYVGVVEHPWFAVSDKQGNFALPAGLPPGQYPLAAMHRKAGEQTQSVTVNTDGTAVVTFTLEVPKP